ncbi:MAG TPA: pteridine reductase [Steroidobacteraceae bacterium]|jgi:pteridine reductase|nr:pteridine reductase [Steroidobacteraceae bacterium]
MEPSSSTQSALAGRAVLITGGARRVGATLVRALHAAGANLLVHCNRSLQAAEALRAELERQRSGSTAVIAADLLDTSALPRLVDRALEHFGRLDMLINNASSFYPTPVGHISLAHWEDLMGTNLRAPLFLTQAAAPALRTSGGSVLNIVDIHGQRPLRDHALYSTAKAGLIMLTRALARELAPEVRVNAIAPGAILWPDGGMQEARKTRITQRTPLQRQGCPEDIARAALFFASAAPFVTGQVLAIDGGRSIAW